MFSGSPMRLGQGSQMERYLTKGGHCMVRRHTRLRSLSLMIDRISKWQGHGSGSSFRRTCCGLRCAQQAPSCSLQAHLCRTVPLHLCVVLFGCRRLSPAFVGVRDARHSEMRVFQGVSCPCCLVVFRYTVPERLLQAVVSTSLKTCRKVLPLLRDFHREKHVLNAGWVL